MKRPALMTRSNIAQNLTGCSLKWMQSRSALGTSAMAPLSNGTSGVIGAVVPSAFLTGASDVRRSYSKASSSPRTSRTAPSSSRPKKNSNALNQTAASFTVVPMDAKSNQKLKKKKRMEEAFQKSMKVSSEINQKVYPGSGLVMPRLPQDLEEDLTFEEFMTKMMKDRDYESMYKKIYGKDPSHDEEYERFKSVMLADPLNEKVMDFRKDDDIDIVELTRDQYLQYRENRVELKYAYAKHGYERIKLYNNPNRKGLYELHLFKPEKKIDKDQQFQINRIKYQLRASLSLSPDMVNDLKAVKKDHEEKKRKKIEEQLLEKEARITKKKEALQKKKEDKAKPLFDRIKEITARLSDQEGSKVASAAAMHSLNASSANQNESQYENPQKTQLNGQQPDLPEQSRESIVLTHAKERNPEGIETQWAESDSRPYDEGINHSNSMQSGNKKLQDTLRAMENSKEDSDYFNEEHFEAENGASPDKMQDSPDNELDRIREFMSDSTKLEKIATELGIPASLLKTIYLGGGLEEMEEMEEQDDAHIDDGLDDLTDDQVSSIAKTLSGKVRFDLGLTKSVVENALAEHHRDPNSTVQVSQASPKSKPVLKFIYEDEFDKLFSLSPEERLLEMREDFALMSLGLVTLPYNVYRRAKNILRGVPRDDLFKAARVLATVLRMRVSGFGKKFEQAANTKVDLDDMEGEQKRILRELKSHQKTLDLNEAGKFSQMEMAEMNLADKRDLKISYDNSESAAYIALRLPGTYGVNYQIMNEITKRLPDWKPRSHLDFGAGVGSSILAANEVWKNDLKDILAIEPSSANMEHAIELTKDINAPIAWRRYLTDHFRRKYDLVTVSFVLNEIPDKEKRMQTLETLWNVTGDVLVIADHGTPMGFNLIREAREFILSRTDVEEMEPTILAPCPHDSVCPMAGTKFCHFRQRIERPDFLRQVKNRALLKKDSHLTRSFEDEGYSYIVIRRKGVTGIDPIEAVKERENARLQELKQTRSLDKEKERLKMEMLLYKRKLAREAHSWPRLIAGSNLLVRKVSMNMCTPQGALVTGEIYPKTIGRKNGYKLARTARRGDLFSFPRRIIDPNKPSARELYLSKKLRVVRDEREEKAKMNKLIEEYGLIPSTQERVKVAQERWKKIKTHWEKPKEDHSFSALKSKVETSDDAEALFSKQGKKLDKKAAGVQTDAPSTPQNAEAKNSGEKPKKQKPVYNGKKIQFLFARGKKRDRL